MNIGLPVKVPFDEWQVYIADIALPDCVRNSPISHSIRIGGIIWHNPVTKGTWSRFHFSDNWSAGPVVNEKWLMYFNAVREVMGYDKL